MNFARDVVDAAPPGRRALVELARDGSRREVAFAEVADRAARMAGALAARGVAKGDVVLTLIGNRLEWVDTMLACFRLGAVYVPANFRQTPAEVAELCCTSGASVLVCGADFPGHAVAVQAAAPGLLTLAVGTAGFGEPWDGLLARHDGKALPDPTAQQVAEAGAAQVLQASMIPRWNDHDTAMARNQAQIRAVNANPKVPQAERERLNAQLQEILDRHTEPWGVKVASVDELIDKLRETGVVG